VDTLRYEKPAYAALFLRQQLLDRRFGLLVFAFAEVRVDHLSLLVDKVEGGPLPGTSCQERAEMWTLEALLKPVTAAQSRDSNRRDLIVAGATV
jgi:hypothetical protein